MTELLEKYGAFVSEFLDNQKERVMHLFGNQQRHITLQNLSSLLLNEIKLLKKLGRGNDPLTVYIEKA